MLLIAFWVVVALVAVITEWLVLAWGLKARKARMWKPNGPPTPGFYRDPLGPAAFRWWDGHRWTDRTAAR